MANDRCDLLRISGEDAVATEGYQHAGEGIELAEGAGGVQIYRNRRLRPIMRRGERCIIKILESSRFVDMVGVTGSIPVAPTTDIKRLA